LDQFREKSGQFVQKALHQRHIEPFIEFSADFALNSHHLEARTLVKGDGTR
jgi:hypothetical protein